MRIIAPSQFDFIKDGRIKGYIAATLENINLLNSKCLGGNMALKIDIRKAFDSMEWVFLMKALHCFSFSDKFCGWISSILRSDRLSISINGSLKGYFS